MAQVSKFMLKPEIWQKMFDIFSDTFLRIKNKRNLNNFLNNFLSPTEKTVLAKRLAIAVLLAKGNDYMTIKRTISVTYGTISKVSLLLKGSNNGLRQVVDQIMKRDSGKLFWVEIMDLIDYKGKGRNWSEVAKRNFQRNKNIQGIKSGLG
jgi:uncharacterized protein YerC